MYFNHIYCFVLFFAFTMHRELSKTELNTVFVSKVHSIRGVKTCSVFSNMKEYSFKILSFIAFADFFCFYLEKG